MELLEVVSAQTVSSGQLKAIRDKIVVDKLLLLSGILSLFPNFDTSASNIQQLRSSLISQYPEVSPALRANRLNSTIAQRENEFKLLSRRRDPNTAIKMEVDWKRLGGVSNFEDFRIKNVFLFNQMLETARLKFLKTTEERKVRRY